MLIAEDGYLKLTDFSFAKVVETRTYTLCGTPEYLAPEILLNQGHGKGVDWWTLGILTYEMNAGIDPFTDEDPMIIYQNILKGKIRFPKDFDKYIIDLCREVKSIIKHLLVADVSKRLGMLKGGADDVKQHKWFSKIDWKALLAKKTPMSYRPPTKNAGDTSNFNTYPESDNITQSLKPADDPFIDW